MVGHELNQGAITALASKSAGYIFLGLAMIFTGLVGYRLENFPSPQAAKVPPATAPMKDTAHNRPQQARGPQKPSASEKQVGR